MYRLGLASVIALDMWDYKKQLEPFLFELLLCEENIHETRQLFKAIEQAANDNKNAYIKQGKKMFDEARKLCNSKNFSKFWEISHTIIHNMPFYEPELKKMLFLRATTFRKFNFIENAILDYEMCIYVSQKTNNSHVFEELALLIDCYYEVGDLEKFHSTFNVLKAEYCKRKITYLKNNKKYDETMKKIDEKEKEFKNKLHSSYLGDSYDERKFRPYLGFKGSLDERISSSSVACTLLTREISGKKYERVLANRFIPTGKIIAFERPLERDYCSPLMQCEYCYRLTSLLYSCLKCQQKRYCRLDCLKRDSIIHKYECPGLETGALFSMESIILFRLLVKSLMYIKKNVFCIDREPGDVNDFFDFVMDNIKYGPQAKIKKVLTNFDNYKTVTTCDINSMATYSVRIAVYAIEKTEILHDFFDKVELEVDKIQIFIASLLLRLQNQLKLNSVEIGYPIVYPENISTMESFLMKSSTEYNQTNPSHNSEAKSIYELCDYSEESAKIAGEKLIKKYLPDIPKVNTDKSRLYFPYKQTKKMLNEVYNATYERLVKIGSPYTLQEKINVAYQSTLEILRIHKVSFNGCQADGTSPVTMQGIYPTIRKFRHSCEPNAVIILLDSGSLVLKAGSNIKMGEELTVAYMTEYISYPNPVRKQYHIMASIDCNCNYCLKNIDYWETINAVICYNCKEAITSYKCKNCHIRKDVVSVFYKNICAMIIDLANNADRNNFSNLKCLCMRYHIQYLMYPDDNQSVIGAKFEFATVCVNENFVCEAFELLQDFHRNLPIVVTEWGYLHSIYLSMTLNLLVSLLLYNLYQNESFVKSNLQLFFDILAFAQYINRNLIFRDDFFELFNVNSLIILNRHQTIIQFKFKLIELKCQTINMDTVHVDDDEMPILLSAINDSLSDLDEDDHDDDDDDEDDDDNDDEDYDNEDDDDEDAVDDCKNYCFYANTENLVSIPSPTKLYETFDINKDYKVNFFCPDVTGSDQGFEYKELTTLIDGDLELHKRESVCKIPGSYKQWINDLHQGTVLNDEKSSSSPEKCSFSDSQEE